MKPDYAANINTSIQSILNDALNGKFPIHCETSNESNLFGDGVSIFLGEDRNLISTPRERKVITLSPKASILIKKKAFSTFKDVNDLQWLDRTEKMLLRATKCLFAYKVAQIRAYESLTKVEDFFEQTSEISLSLFAELLDNAKFLNVDASETNSNLFQQLVSGIGTTLKDAGYDNIKEDVLMLLERNAFAGDLQFTTWIVDPNSLDNYETGPGTGVIEIGMYSGFNTETNLNTEPCSADFTLEDPYRIMNITEADIEVSIEEALVGTLGLLSALTDPEAPPIDTRSILGAGLEFIGLGSLDPSINVNYIRDRLRNFYLGKPFINCGDGVHFFIRGNRTVQDFSNQIDVFDKDFLAVDETIFEAERILFTKGKLDLETYKNIRQFSDNSFGMKHVFGGFIMGVSENWTGGKWILKVSCIDNMGWLNWSRFMITPALQDPAGVLEDPLTPYEIKTDATGMILSASGPQLLEENKRLIKSGLLFYDSGILNGQVATENNLLQGQYNKSGSLSGTKIFQHPQGLVYRWKEGIITATAGVNLIDPFNEKEVNQALHNQTYGLTVAQDVLNNLDIANILSILIVGQPYNVETFVDQAYQVHNINRQGASAALTNTDPLSAVLNVVRRQNNHFGYFRPYRMITMSSQTLLQTANSNILRNSLNENVRQLQQRRAQLDSLLRKLQSSSAGGNILINSLEEEKRSINAGIAEQMKILNDSGVVSSTDLITQNFNLFGKSKTLPLTGNYTADHQTTRAMTMIGAQRRIEDVRLNRDQNLFIVSDQYDEQTDIRPYIFNIKSADYKIFKGNFVSVYDKCSEAAKFVNLEFFTNPEGHLEFRPPQWNKTPLTVLQRLFEISKDTGKEIVPKFLTEVFQTRSSSLRREIHGLNVRIVLLCLLLNKYPDRSIIPNFDSVVVNNILPAGSEKSSSSLKFFGISEVPGASVEEQALDLRDGKFQFGVGNLISTGNQIFGTGLNIEIGLGKDGDLLNGNTTTLLGNFDPLFQESVGLVNNVLTTAAQPTGDVAIKIANASNLNYIRESFTKLSGIDPASDLVSNGGKFQASDFIFNNNSTSSSAEANNLAKANNYLKKLQETISKRDSIVTILQRNEEKERELEEVGEILSGEFTAGEEAQAEGFLSGVINSTNKIIDVLDRASNTVKTISDIFTGDATKGTLFDHLISDDTRNFQGPGSGRRFIINDEDIITCNFSEQPPDFCRIDVVGDAPVIGDALNAPFQERYFWAGATDFDLWRQYGYQHGGNRSLPFASDAELQSKPYAIFELQLQRVKINKGSMTVVGNEYYEPGDTVYIPSKELLYYVRAVSHNYELGQSFTTSLTLEFGHPPGTYLPSPLDIIGQQFTKDPLTGTILTYRNSQGDDSYRALQPDSAIVFPPNQNISQDEIAVLLDYKDNAVRFTNMMADLSSIMIGDRIILIRGFLKGKSDPDEEMVRANIETIKQMILNPVSLTQTNPTSITDDIFDTVSSNLRKLGKETGTTKSTVSMTLPNGLPVLNISAEQIAEQIVFLEKEGSSSEIQSLNARLKSAQILDSKLVNTKDYDSVFPKGGPKQRSWLDIKINDSTVSSTTVFKVSNVIEIGILDLGRSMETGIEKQNSIVSKE